MILQIIVIITDSQLSLIREYGNRVALVDDTHHISRYTMKTCTVMGLDGKDRGRPLAYMLVKEPNERWYAHLWKVRHIYISC